MLRGVASQKPASKKQVNQVTENLDKIECLLKTLPPEVQKEIAKKFKDKQFSMPPLSTNSTRTRGRG